MDALFLGMWVAETRAKLVDRRILEVLSRGPFRFLLRTGGPSLAVSLERSYPGVWLDDRTSRARAGFPGAFGDVLAGDTITGIAERPGERILELTTSRGTLILELRAARPAVLWTDLERTLLLAHTNASKPDPRLEPGARYSPLEIPSGTRWPGVDRRLAPFLARWPAATWEEILAHAREEMAASGGAWVLRDARGVFVSPVPIDGAEVIGNPTSIDEAGRLAQRHGYRMALLEEEARAFDKRVSLLLARLDRTIAACRNDLATAREWPAYERKGSAILAALHLVRRGQTSVTAPDVFDESARPIVIPIDPKLSPSANGALYLKKAERGRRAVDTVTERLAALESERAWVGDRRECAKSEWSSEELAHLSLLCARHHVGGANSAAAEPRTAARGTGGFHPRRYRSREGWIILVGRNNAENDWLTHRLSKPNDLWFHAQGVPGSHVVLRRDGRKDNPSRHALEEAASLAAAFSKARHSGKVPVMYTAIKYVWKPRKSAPGIAACIREKTLLVAPADPSKLTLADEGVS